MASNHLMASQLMMMNWTKSSQEIKKEVDWQKRKWLKPPEWLIPVDLLWDDFGRKKKSSVEGLARWKRKQDVFLRLQQSDRIPDPSWLEYFKGVEVVHAYRTQHSRMDHVDHGKAMP